ncbi:NAD(P)H-dependent oxidoreductase KNAG_0H01480 [Huiozyma naganishii CBS 8797]|uniref:Flavodoxin-like fold domain-containing protein n=1 Tax=Huiozyma naganishii (strain ATCC MYA-139 / BCRC 22969 / CBS 8797 / KCTC 17520 / NBRC 10181 / NCYC 3082 / Yp74L-3) TaxID=1071383 RepID=J7S1Q0_HUIN7|nr:hypothetical protein KNAG_0H01480 [Kazachstania naganishii CBS 8797]CCK71562.1 hypothetical protein KNAG_0H01480 [Kazachstania naganishii CBS 8797]
MKIFIVFAHPESRSYGGSLLKSMVEHLTSQGHEVRVADLYKQGFKATVTEDDFLNFEKGSRLKGIDASIAAAAADAFTDDVKEAQANLMWADFVLFQSPLWWFSVPAILKGWFDRVFSGGFAYGTPEDDKLKNSTLIGRKAMLVLTAAIKKEPSTGKSIHVPMNDLLLPITRGTLKFIGLTVLPSYVMYDVDNATEETFAKDAKYLNGLLDNIDTIEPIDFHRRSA